VGWAVFFFSQTLHADGSVSVASFLIIKKKDGSVSVFQKEMPAIQTS